MNKIAKSYIKRWANGIIDQIAQREHVSSEAVRSSMEEAIRAGFNNEDPKVREIWKEITSKNGIPTPEELILWAANRAHTI